jgi:hypothetical protein
LDITRAGNEVCMRDFMFNPQRDITIYELALVVEAMTNFSVFPFVPTGTERHFKEMPDCDIQEQKVNAFERIIEKIMRLK